jgi:DNA-binding NtrC family response regulator
LFLTKILIVEDRYDVLSLLKDAFSDENKVIAVDNFESAMFYIDYDFDIIITDILLKDGKNIGIVFTGHEEIKCNNEDYVDYFFKKPLPLQKIFKIIENQKDLSMRRIANSVDDIRNDIEKIKEVLKIK